MQSKLDSFIEAWLNVLIGFGISVLANFVIFPLVGIGASTTQIITVGIFMTIVSVIRSYIVRRFCQANLRNMVQYMLGAFDNCFNKHTERK